MTQRPGGAPARPRSPSIATALSFLWPGLGQWYAGRPRSAALYALPVVLVGIIFALSIMGGVAAFAADLIDPSVALTVLILSVVLGGWRLLSMLDALALTGGRRALRSRAGVVLAVLGLVTVGAHGVASYYAWAFFDAGSRIFVGEPGPDASPDGRGPSGDPDYEATPVATPDGADARITILLTGIDSSPDRNHALTDTLLVVTLDPKTGSTTMISFPRDIAEFPLWDGRTFKGKINSLMSYARSHPESFPDGPLPTLINELGFLLGTPIHYYAAIDLGGFEALIDAVDGVTVTVERRIADPRYNWLDGSPKGFYLDAGTHTLDGRTALAFVRSRYGAGDSDFTRAGRQQLILSALRAKLTEPRMIGVLPELLNLTAEIVRTNFPPDRLAEMLEIARGVDDGKTRRIVLQPPTYSYHPPTDMTGGSYILRLKLEALAALSIELFGTESRYWSAGAP